MATCWKCGADLRGAASYCPICGCDLNAASRQQPAGPSGAGRQLLSNDDDQGLTFTAVCGGETLVAVRLSDFRRPRLTFGTLPDNDIVIDDPTNTVSRHHGALVFSDGFWTIESRESTNGLYANGRQYERASVDAGDVFTVGPLDENRHCVVLLFGRADFRWASFDLDGRDIVSVGRAPDNDVVLPFSTVSSYHATLRLDRYGRWFAFDNQSFNGTFVNGSLLDKPKLLVSGSLLRFANVTVVYSGSRLLYTGERLGVDVTAFELTKYRKVRRQTRVTNDNISLHIKRGQFVAIAGGSGSGKTTLLNALCGSEPADEGCVFIDGIELYPNYQQLKNTIGYVPQQDIVYDNLTLADMLKYSAQLRMPPDSTQEEQDQRIDEVIELLELQGVRNNLISNMSGGQKKRASIAVELLADPRLLFLDEPTSGLDPGIERHLMEKLAQMAHEGRTIILVTHTTLNLHLCDQVVFLGVGGKLCFAGPPQQALDFFGASDFVNIYPEIDNPQGAASWSWRFSQTRDAQTNVPDYSDEREVRESPGFAKQFATLSSRYMKLLVNDRARLLLLLLQAPVLAALICLVAGKGCFTEYESTKSCLFALSCAAFWVGILDSIQEICKERDIFEREYAGGMRIGAYVLSKCAVLGGLCMVQALLLTVAFCAFESMPAKALVFVPLELFVTNFFLTFSAMCLGLLVSALFRNPDRAIAMAPLLIMPQILFSGLVFELKGVAEKVSLFVHCRWGMEAFGTTANLNGLDLVLYGEEITVPETETTIDSVTTNVPSFETDIGGQTVTVPEQNDMTIENVQVTVPEDVWVIDSTMYPHDYEPMFEFSLPHLMTDWGILLAFGLVCIAGCCAILRVKSSS